MDLELDHVQVRPLDSIKPAPENDHVYKAIDWQRKGCSRQPAFGRSPSISGSPFLFFADFVSFGSLAKKYALAIS
jgi:hypothetical protein